MLSKGQRDDFLTYMATGTVAMWALGGLPGLLAASVFGACGLGALANQLPAVTPTTDVDDRVQCQLRDQYGESAVENYRANRITGMSPQIAAREAIFAELQSRNA